jgi:hypothetical protein
MTLLSAELSYPVSFETLPERQFLTRLIGAGVAPAQAELLITREWAIQAGENERLTSTVHDLTGRGLAQSPRPRFRRLYSRHQ